MAAAAVADDDYEDIGYIPPPTQPAPSDRYDNDIAPLSSLDHDDLIDSTQSSSTSSLDPSSSASLSRALLVAWQNELHSPSLLPYQVDLVRAIQPLLTTRQSLIDNPADPPTTSTTATTIAHTPITTATPTWQLNLYQLELDRLQYTLTDYHRIRLIKLQAAPIHTTIQLTQRAGARRLEQLPDDEVEQRLGVSAAELQFVLGYVDIWERVMRSEYLDHMPAVGEGEQAKQLMGVGGEMVKSYDEGWFVLLRVVIGDGRERVMMDEIEVELREGEIWLVRYEPFKQLLIDGKVQLI